MGIRWKCFTEHRPESSSHSSFRNRGKRPCHDDFSDGTEPLVGSVGASTSGYTYYDRLAKSTSLSFVISDRKGSHLMNLKAPSSIRRRV